MRRHLPVLLLYAANYYALTRVLSLQLVIQYLIPKKKHKKSLTFFSKYDFLKKSDIRENRLNSELSSSKELTKKRSIKGLSYLRIKNKGKLVTGNINLNSISSKFDQLKCLVEGNIDILFVTETVVDESFHTKQFIDGFSKTY